MIFRCIWPAIQMILLQRLGKSRYLKLSLMFNLDQFGPKPRLNQLQSHIYLDRMIDLPFTTYVGWYEVYITHTYIYLAKLLGWVIFL